jgi:hypothetical protein
VPLSSKKSDVPIVTNVLPIEIQQAAERGLRIFPYWPRGKHSRITHWTELATTNLEQLQKRAAQLPGSNWATQTGEPGGFFVLDTDDRLGQCWLDAQVAAFGKHWAKL